MKGSTKEGVWICQAQGSFAMRNESEKNETFQANNAERK